MTNEEVVEELKADIELYDNEIVRLDAFKGTPDRRLIDSLEMAIKALEQAEKYKWHDLRKNPDDLPDDGELVDCQHLPNVLTDKKELVIRHRFVCGKFVLNWDLDTDIHSPTFGKRYMGDVIAWREIKPFEEEGEE